MDSLPHITDAEWEVMKVIWKRRRCDARQVIDDLAPSESWTPATVKTLLNRLLTKGLLHFEKSGKAYLYSAAVSEKACRAAEADTFLKRVFDGALSPMLAHFVQSRKLRPQELAELEALLRKKEGKP